MIVGGMAVERLGVVAAMVVIGGGMEQCLDEELGVIEKGEAGAAEEIDLCGVGVEGDEETFPLKEGEDEDAFIAEPEGAYVAVTAAVEMSAGVVDGLEEALGAKFFEGKEIDKNLPPPGEELPIDGTGVLEALECGAQGGGDGGCHGIMPPGSLRG
jgi:hypothetical protein